MLTTALAAITTQVDHLIHSKALQVATLSAQPGIRAGENPAATPSAFFDPNMEEQVWMHVVHQVISSHPPLLAITDDESDVEEEVGLLAPRKAQLL